MTAREATLGLDIGTTSVKAVVFAEDGAVVARASVRLPMHHPQPGYAEQDVLEIEPKLRAVLAQAVQQAADAGLSIRRCGFSAAMHSLLAVEEDGTPLTPALTWMDLRSADTAASLRRTCGTALYRETGTPVHPMTPLVKLAHLRQLHPDLWTRAARFVSIKEWFWHRWFGVWETDEAMAGATGLYALGGGWAERALELTGVAPGQLGTPVPVYHTRRGQDSRWLTEVGLADCQWTIGGSDGVMANVGAGVWGPDALVLTVGTSLAVRTTHLGPLLDEDTQIFSYPLGRGLYVVGGPSNSGGGVLEWFAQTLLGGQDLARLLEAAGREDPAGITVLPYAAGERAPLWDPSASAAILGLRLDAQPAQIMRAAVEGVLLNARWIADPLLARLRPQRLWVSGKLFDHAWIRQFTADLFGLPTGVKMDGDGSATGAAVMAEISAGNRAWGRGETAQEHVAWHVPNPASHAALAERMRCFADMARRWATG